MGVWVAYLNDIQQGKPVDNLRAAQLVFEKPYYLKGLAEIYNRRTGAVWKRKKGGWYNVTPAHRSK